MLVGLHAWLLPSPEPQRHRPRSRHDVHRLDRRDRPLHRRPVRRPDQPHSDGLARRRARPPLRRPLHLGQRPRPRPGGHNEAPSPVAYLLGGLAGCAVAFLANTLAPQFGVEIEEASATARCVNDLAGVLGVEGTDPALTGIAVEIRVSSPSPPQRVAAMQEAWLQRCPVYLALRDANPVDVTFT